MSVMNISVAIAIGLIVFILAILFLAVFTALIVAVKADND